MLNTFISRSAITCVPPSPVCPPHLCAPLTCVPPSPMCPPHLCAPLTCVPPSPVCPPHLCAPSPVCPLTCVPPSPVCPLTYVPPSPVCPPHLCTPLTCVPPSPMCPPHLCAPLISVPAVPAVLHLPVAQGHLQLRQVLLQLQQGSHVSLREECGVYLSLLYTHTTTMYMARRPLSSSSGQLDEQAI